MTESELTIKKLDDKVPCPLCGPDGEMEAKQINDRTYIWICDMCPGVLFEFHGSYNINDLREYLERDR